MEDEVVPEENSRPKEKRHDAGGRDLERVTDHAEETEISAPVDVANLVGGLAAPKAEKLSLRKEDVEILVSELNISKAHAERKLRQHRGDLYKAINDLLAF